MSTQNETAPAVDQQRLVRLGDYVLATKYSDRDPGDPWRVGYVVRIIEWWRPHPKLPTKIEKRYIIGEADGTWSDFREYAHCLHITPEEGKAWLEANRPEQQYWSQGKWYGDWIWKASSRVPLTTPWPELPPVDPYAELKAAHAAGKVIEIKLKLSEAWTTYTGDFSNLDSRYELRIKPWTLPPPPPGKQWHDQGWMEDMLPDGYRPLFLGEQICKDDEYYAWNEGPWKKAQDAPTGDKSGNFIDDDDVKFRTTRPLPAEPEFIDLGPEDCPPGTVFRGAGETSSEGWCMLTSCSLAGIRYWRHCDQPGCGKEYPWSELRLNGSQINRSIPLTGKWDATAWEPCHKPKP